MRHSTSIGEESIASTCSGLPVRSGIAPPARLAMERSRASRVCGSRRARLVMSHWNLRSDVMERTRSRPSGSFDREKLPARHLLGRRTRCRDAAGRGAATTCSIFIASRVTNGSPASTSCAGATWTARTAPGIGERDVTGPPARATADRPPRAAAARRRAAAPDGTRRFGRPRRHRRSSPARTSSAPLAPATGPGAAAGAESSPTGSVAVGDPGTRRRSRPSSAAIRQPRPGVQPPPAVGDAADQASGGRPGRRRRPVDRRPAVGRPDLVEGVGPGLPVNDRGLPDEPAQEAQVRDQAQDDRPVEGRGEPVRAPRPGPGRRPRSWPASGRTGRRSRRRARSRRPPGSPRRSASGAPRPGPGGGQEAGLGILGVEPDLDRVAARDRARSISVWSSVERRSRPRSGADRRRGRARSQLGDGVFHLEPRVHLEEGRPAAVVDEELARACARRSRRRAPRASAASPRRRRSGSTRPATAPPRGPSGDGAGSSSRARRGGPRGRSASNRTWISTWRAPSRRRSRISRSSPKAAAASRRAAASASARAAGSWTIRMPFAPAARPPA